MYADKQHPIPAVTAAVVKDGKILLTLRSQSVQFPKQWCLPGGRVQGGQDWQKAMETELEEEVGLKCKSSQLLGIYSNGEENILIDEPTGKKSAFVVVAFLVTEFEGTPQTSSEVDEIRWCDLNSLPSPLLKSEKTKVLDALQFKGKVFVK